MTTLDAYIQRMAEDMTSWLDAQLTELAPGSTLCVHEENHVDGQLWQLNAHDLKPGFRCAINVRKTQYGPKPNPAEQPEADRG